jgi:hypothetical protein
MQRKLIKHCLFFMLLVLKGCNLSDMGDCFMSTGRIHTEEYPAENIRVISLHDNIDLYIYPDTLEKLMITAGKNLLAGIEIFFDDTILTLRNYNSCNWVRNLNTPVEAHLHTSSLHTLNYSGYGNVSTVGAISDLHSFRVEIRDGFGKVDLELDCHHTLIRNYSGTAAITLEGKGHYLSVVTGSLAPVNTVQLRADHVYVNTFSANDVSVFAGKILDVEIHSKGNIFYRGNPQITILRKTGMGNVIPLEYSAAIP